MAYDFKTLNDKEFEHLVADLLSHQLGMRIERFRPGKDKGVDGRFFHPAVKWLSNASTGHEAAFLPLSNIWPRLKNRRSIA